MRVKLKYIDELNDERRRLAAAYDIGIRNDKIILPKVRDGANSIYHQYVICCREREELQKFLQEKDIQTQIHYPIPPHLAECYRH